ncbi:uncharacterized protein LOC116343363 [Contarinia nasturtii]|uniref:uncharacterized protein LOC116343363 n=1 Tax=Contarinia nasturtii TaxID=265458 RepID=UPI0012D3BAF4|nr:uncharacterized protein LOC116343363 [Contarinia nasturtii]
MEINKIYIVLAVLSIFCFANVLSIRCYQCSTQTDVKGVDSCGAYKKFNASEHIAIECNSDESHMPGSFCMKVVQQGPRGFIWDGRWRHVIRRCASVADTGVTGVCNWGVYENGDYWEECYCSHDACNGSDQNRISTIAIIISTLVMYAVTARN